jgi:hypothetical protein
MVLLIRGDSASNDVSHDLIRALEYLVHTDVPNETLHLVIL